LLPSNGSRAVRVEVAEILLFRSFGWLLFRLLPYPRRFKRGSGAKSDSFAALAGNFPEQIGTLENAAHG
jgi:hypothetical protein